MTVKEYIYLLQEDVLKLTFAMKRDEEFRPRRDVWEALRNLEETTLHIKYEEETK